MISLVRAITGESAGDFWIEEEDGDYSLQFSTYTAMTRRKREELLKSSTTGKNSGRTGVIGRIVDVLDRHMEGHRDDGVPSYYTQGMILADEPGKVGHGTDAGAIIWSLNQYKNSLTKAGEEGTEEWDALERSILTRVADDVSVSIRSGTVKIVIRKTLHRV